MRNWFLIIGLISSPLVFGIPCDGAPGKNHTHPDGALGGFVANTAVVEKTVFLDSKSSVCEHAKIQGTVKITSSEIFGAAKVHGRAEIVSSTICQASDINFNVSKSDYYCQTDEPEPKHPGEIGEKTLLGIDSDNDGVRDDVEI